MISQKTSAAEAVFLMDNGSLRPAATLGLRRMAEWVAHESGREVLPVSVLHSDKVPVAALEGVPAEVFTGAIPRLLNAGIRRFVVLPFFFGPSRALSDYLPEQFAGLSQGYAGVELVVAPPLGGTSSEPDPRLAQALAERIGQVRTTDGWADASVLLVDHGSPVRAVAELRNRVGEQLTALLKREVLVSSMERRPGPEYAFNEPLLENLLGSPGLDRGRVIVAQLFLLEGRHAGPEGDIASICAEAESRHPGLVCCRTELLGGHPLLGDILLDRLRGAI